MKKVLLLTAALLGSMGAMTAFADTDGQTYDAVDGVACVNLWAYENATGLPDAMATNTTRSAAIDINAGKVYVGDYNAGCMYVFDLVTGEYLEAKTISLTEGGSALIGSYWCMSMCFDDYGHLVAGSSGAGSSTLTVYTVDVDKGVATLLSTFTVNEEGVGGRTDYLDAKGDVTGAEADGVIMCAPTTGGLCVYRWVRAKESDTWTGGFAEDKNYITVSEATNSATAWGTSAMIRVISTDSEYFIVDGGSTLPVVYNMSGVKMGSISDSNTGPNGVDVFSVGEKQFIAYAADPAASSDCLTKVCEIPNGVSDFTDISNAWSLPLGGLSDGVSNGINYRSIDAQEGTCDNDILNAAEGVYLLDYDDENICAVYFFYEPEAAVVASFDAENVYGNSATLLCYLTLGNEKVTATGFYYSTEYQTAEDLIANGTQIESWEGPLRSGDRFYNSITTEGDGTKYYAVAYATTASGTIYSDVIDFEATSGIATIDASAAEKVEVARYDIVGRQLAAPQQGVNIVRYSDGSVEKVIEK